ncbi:hypothetical protein N7650_08610 [Pseudomonas sp. GD04058]|uniref:hypothetical protein n=1 Tax=Pseudomonas sp. GD04058 TaxID=2975429 RepID=UPI00244B2C2B|nr:hypothetical protein [Pseudomonas sp. GD04058]MDG9882893.1 hypothetical protein [Pseudomonas sp. GD04058]
MANQHSGKNPGDLDIDFGQNGFMPFPEHLDFGQSRLLQDGRILTAGSRRDGQTLVLVRHLTTGLLDTSYAEQGIAYITPPFARDLLPKGLWLLPDGSALVHCGVGNLVQNDALVLRVTPNGDLDTSFGVAGYCVLNLGGGTTNIAGGGVLSDGRIILALLAQRPGSPSPWIYLARLDNGHLDPSFGDNGSGLIHVGEDLVSSVIVLPNDGVMLVAPTDFDYVKVLLLQFLADGRPDPAFGDDGMASLTLADGHVDIQSLVRQADGKLLAAGSGDYGADLYTLTTRLNPHGSRDESFNNGNPRLTAFPGYETISLACALQGDGKIVTGGHSLGSLETYNVVLMRFLANGELDNGFGNNGQVMTNLGGVDECYQVEIQRDGKILASGASRLNPNGTAYFVARYLG